MELFLLYLWLKLDTVINLLGGLTTISVLLILGTLLIAGVSEGEYFFKRVLKWAIVGACSGVVLITVLPTSKQAAVLVAGHYALKISESPEAAKVMSVLRKKANEFLDAELAAPEKQAK